MLSRVEILSLAASPSSMSAPKNWVSPNFLGIAFWSLHSEAPKAILFKDLQSMVFQLGLDMLSTIFTISDLSFWCQEKLAKALPSVVVRSKSRNLGARGDSLPNRLAGWVFELFFLELSVIEPLFVQAAKLKYLQPPYFKITSILHLNSMNCLWREVFWECAFLWLWSKVSVVDVSHFLPSPQMKVLENKIQDACHCNRDVPISIKGTNCLAIDATKVWLSVQQI